MKTLRDLAEKALHDLAKHTGCGCLTCCPSEPDKCSGCELDSEAVDILERALAPAPSVGKALDAARAALGEAWSDLHEWCRTTRHSRENVPKEYQHFIGHERGMAETEKIRARVQAAIKLVEAALAERPQL